MELCGFTGSAGIQDDEADGNLALHGILHADDRALGHVRVPRQDLFHAPGREPVPGDVDDVVGAAHDEEIAVVVQVAGVARLVVTGVAIEIRGAKASLVVPQRRQAARRQRQLDDDVAGLASGTRLAGVVDDLHPVARNRHRR